MITLSMRVRLILIIVAVADFIVFSHHSLLAVLAQATGAALVLLGTFYSYRPSSVTGLMIVVSASAASIELPSLLEVGQILTAIVSLAIPAIVLAWLALSAEEGESKDVILLERPAIIALTYALVCLWSAPIVILIVSLFLPTMTARISPTTEITIILMTTIVGAILLTRLSPATTKTPETTGEAE